MPIRFRCMHCRGLMAISSRKAGAIVQCPTCGESTLVPQQEDLPTAAAQTDGGNVAPEISFQPYPSSPPQQEADKVPGEFSPDFEDRSAEPTSPDDHENAAISSESADYDDRQIDRQDVAPDVFRAAKDDDAYDERDDDRDDDDRDEDESEGENENDQDHNQIEDENVDHVPSEEDDEEEDAPLSIRRCTAGDEEMDLTPMVDVTFQLLIFFMVSASFSLQKSIEVPTPEPDQKGATQQVQTLDDLQGTSILVKIDASNTIWIDEDQLADAHRLVDTLRDKMRREQKTELLVTAHPLSLHRTTIAVVDAANEIGVQKIRMSSHKKSD